MQQNQTAGDLHGVLTYRFTVVFPGNSTSNNHKKKKEKTATVIVNRILRIRLRLTNSLYVHRMTYNMQGEHCKWQRWYRMPLSGIAITVT